MGDRRGRVASEEERRPPAVKSGSRDAQTAASRAPRIDLVPTRVPVIQRKSAAGAPEPAPEPAAEPRAEDADKSAGAAGLIIDDGQAPGPGQMTRSVFLAQLRESTTATAAEILGPVWARGGCPYLEAWFARHGGDDAATLERLVQRYGGRAGSAADYITAASARLRDGITRWSAGVALGEHLNAAGLGGAAANEPAGAVMAKEAPGARVGESGSPARVAGQLGRGEPLDAGVAGRLGGALGEQFGDVRVHTDAHAARLADQLGASAFTVGSHVAFAAGEYQPGTITGEALLAHELAHVAQQRSASMDGGGLAPGGLAHSAYEEDADQAAVGAMAQLYRAGSAAAAKLNARPRLSSGLSLRGCPKKKSGPEPPPNRPAPKSDHKDLTKGTMTWTLSPYLSMSAQMQISFKPKASVGNKTVTFVQTVLYTTTSGGEANGEIIPGKGFKPAQRRVDIVATDTDPFYGAAWDGSKWVAESDDPSQKSAPSTPKDGSAYMYDQPSVNSSERQLFESVAMVPETGELLGALKWGVEYGESGADRWKLLGAEQSDCTDAPSADFAPTLEKFYAQRYDAILDRFPANDASLTAAQQGQLDGIAAQVPSGSTQRVRVAGFADPTETDPTKISNRRAQAVYDYLKKKGVPESSMKAAGFGAVWPRFPATPSDERNRRVQVMVRDAEQSELQPPAPDPAPATAPDAGAGDAGTGDAGSGKGKGKGKGK